MREMPKRSALTIAEILVALSITAIVFAGIIMLSEFVQVNWKTMRVKSNITGQIEMCLERMKKEIGMTDAYQVFYYPEDGATYTAISFPLGVHTDSNGFAELEAVSGRIIWDKTVIYHTYANSETAKVELRRTIFDGRSSMTNSERQRQLNEVAANGQPVSGTPDYDYWNADTGTRTFFSNDDIVLNIMPTVREFDGYSSSVARSENVTFGSVPVTSGSHYITFTVTGKSAGSTGRKMGIDCFAMSPSGGVIEAEEAGIRDDGGSGKVNEDMSGYGKWSANRHLEYQASSVGDHISMYFYYDNWIETNFASSSPNYTVIEYGARTGDEAEISGSNDYAMRLNGCGDSWSAASQTGSGRTQEAISIAGDVGVNIRNMILSKYIDVEGDAARIRFDNAGPEDMKIDYACIMQQSDGPDGVSGTGRQITFDGGASFATVAAGSYEDSDWINVNDFDKSKNYLVSFHVSEESFPKGDHTLSGWSASETFSYTLEGAKELSSQEMWSDKASTERAYIHTVSMARASYFSYGTLTSQVYDTQLDNPSYGTLSWAIAKNNYGNYTSGGLGANLIIKVRSNDSEDALKADNSWTGAVVINTMSQTSGSASISGIGSGRYVQFMAEFYSQASSGASFDYLKTCVLKRVSIDWPGQERIVDVGGYFTRRPDYGIFSISVDGRDLIKALECKLQISEKTHSGQTATKSMTVEMEPRNTGK